MNSTELSSLVDELKHQLAREAVDGLPRSWLDDPKPIERPLLQSLTSASLTYAQLRAEAEECRKCRLCETRHKVVFGSGKLVRPLIAFVGEGPGADEDLQGEPFVGKAGALLTSAITKGLSLGREEVYFCNVVKCRPPENRTPLVDEVEACSPYLFQQLELVAPQVIVTLGASAQLTLVGSRVEITNLRGKWLEWRGIPVMPTFDPAYILTNPEAKRPFWEDLQAVMQRVGLKSKGAGAQ